MKKPSKRKAPSVEEKKPTKSKKAKTDEVWVGGWGVEERGRESH